MTDAGILIGKSDKPEELLLKRANRHGLVTGATGTGKTVTLQVLAEGFSNAGVPVFAAEVPVFSDPLKTAELAANAEQNIQAMFRAGLAAVIGD